VAVEMWKKDLSVVSSKDVFHNGCGKGCGNLAVYVEKRLREKVFHISTGNLSPAPVEMWKTLS
jgi:hypothetical protein